MSVTRLPKEEAVFTSLKTATPRIQTAVLISKILVNLPYNCSIKDYHVASRTLRFSGRILGAGRLSPRITGNIITGTIIIVLFAKLLARLIAGLAIHTAPSIGVYLTTPLE